MTTQPLAARLAAATPERPVRLGHYDVTGLIGEGGMGSVYGAIDIEHGTRVALKTLSHMDPASLLRFKNEFRLVAGLSHPNLVSLYELARHDDLWFFTMDLIDGVDFIEWVRGKPAAAPSTGPRTLVASPRGRKSQAEAGGGGEQTASAPPSLPRVREALAQLIAGVHALHEAGYLHLDLKPNNVLVDGSGRLFILDFGLIRPVDDQRPATDGDADSIRISGTPMWMAPEQFSRAPIGKPADWYAVGLMLYWGLTGVPAFPPAPSASATGAMRQRMQAGSPRERVADLPLDLSELAVALLQGKPADRPSGKTLLELTAADEVLATRQRAAFVGRESELDALRAAYRRVGDGGAAVVHLSAPSGLGKTALLRRFFHEIRGVGGLALSGRCYERESVPYKAFDGLLDQLVVSLESFDDVQLDAVLPVGLPELVRVFPVLAGVPGIAARLDSLKAPDKVTMVELRRRAVEALRALFEQLAVSRPLVLEIDDLQWADADSVALLVRLLAPAAAGVMLVLSFRPEEAAANQLVAPYFEEVGRLEEGLLQIEVGPLPPVDAETLARRQLAELDIASDKLSAAIADESGGVPFFIEELCHFVSQLRAETGELTPGIALEIVLAERVRSLPERERALVEVLSVANSPIPLWAAFNEAGLASGALRTLWSLRGRHLIRTTGVGADDVVELHHDRMRESVLAYLPDQRIDDIHLGLARLFVEEDDGDGAWLFDAVRHFNNVHHHLTGSERKQVAQLNRDAGDRARRAAAFPLAFACFRAGVQLLEDDAWERDYQLALALHSGAAESAYLSAEWAELDGYIDAVKRHGRTILDQLVGWEVQIDACIGRKEYAEAVATAIEALQLLDIELVAEPGEAEVAAAVQDAMGKLAAVGPDGLQTLPLADDPRAIAGMRIQSRIMSAAYFATPQLLPVLACRLVSTSVDRGLSSLTAYALAVYGIVLNTLGMHREAYTWGRTALALLDRFDDPAQEARTRHVAHNLVCCFAAPLLEEVMELRKVVDIGKATGDIEYAAYAAHGYIHNAMYAGSDLRSLYQEALELGDFMRGHEQVNALHVHEPFEQQLRCLLGLNPDPARLDSDEFGEEEALAAAAQVGSSAGVALLQTVMGMTRYLFGAVGEAHDCFVKVRPMLAAMPSVWHVPMFHQFAALAIYALDSGDREPWLADADTDLAALRHMAEQGPENFAHRVELLEAERARVAGDIAAAMAGYQRAVELAEAGGWINDVALAHELAARCAVADDVAAAHAAAARAAYARWGAAAKAGRSAG